MTKRAEISKEIFKVVTRTFESKEDVYKRENLASIANLLLSKLRLKLVNL